ncbi:MAG TPA: NAD(P)-binding domain-containing protein [Phycisphaerae bacterium]|nr:NAD(P)-binding domain-containing protein [Phycisphaerae bacterium]
MPTPTDILLIGAGPLGIEMAVGLQRAGLRYRHLEAHQIGATMQWWPPGTRWFSSNERISIAGVPLVTPFQEKATREEYLAYLRAVVEQFNLQIHTYTRVTGIERDREGFVVHSQRNIAGQLLGEPQKHHAQKVILATGGTERPNLLHIPGENLPHVSHYFRDPHTYFGQRVMIVGGKNSAVEAALRCHRAGAKVLFCYRGAEVDKDRIKYWLYPEFSSLIKSGAILPFFSRNLVEIKPDHVLMSGPAGPEAAEVDFVLLMTGYLADMSLARMAGVTLNDPSEVPTLDPETMETNVPGLYVVGTAIAGTQGGERSYKVFLENCHVHVERVVSHLKGKREHVEERVYDRPES